MRYAGKRVVVVGLGASGWAAARALLDLGADVYVTEAGDSSVLEERAAALRERGAEVEIGGHQLDRISGDIAVVSPGIPPTSDIIKALVHSEIPVISEVEFAYRIASCDFLAVTGTNGKTTTTSLLAAMLDLGGVPSVAAGNIGLPLIEAVSEVGRGGAIAVEVSSFQLAGIVEFHPRVAVVLNVAEDHTDWHGSMDAYADAKARIVENQTSGDYLVVNRDDERAWAIARAASSTAVPFSTRSAQPYGIALVGDDIVWRGSRLLERSRLPLPGRAGVEDAMAAAAAALSYGIAERAVVEALTTFEPLHHRLEVVGEIDGVTYIDDSKATNPHATLAAVSDLSDVVLIAGGRSKGIDLSPLRDAVPPVIAVVGLGEAADELEELFRGVVPFDRASSMTAAVAAARARSVPGGSVLLAPGCASLDMYESYAARGDDFVRAVNALEAGRGEGREGEDHGDTQ